MPTIKNKKKMSQEVYFPVIYVDMAFNFLNCQN